MRPEQGFNPDDAPRVMADPDLRLRRQGMLNAPHMAPLSEYAGKLRERGNVEIPDFAPLDGGTVALALFLFEKPGPMTRRWGRQAGWVGLHQQKQR